MLSSRVVYYLDVGPGIVLMSHSNHATESPEEVFRAAVQRFGFCHTSLVRALLNATYGSGCGRHRPGGHMFELHRFPDLWDRQLVVRYGNVPGQVTVEEIAGKVGAAHGTTAWPSPKAVARYADVGVRTLAYNHVQARVRDAGGSPRCN